MGLSRWPYARVKQLRKREREVRQHLRQGPRESLHRELLEIKKNLSAIFDLTVSASDKILLAELSPPTFIFNSQIPKLDILITLPIIAAAEGLLELCAVESDRSDFSVMESEESESEEY